MDNRPIVDALIKFPFLNLDIEKQAHALTIFTQLKHNNPYIDELEHKFSTLFFHDDYNDRFSNFKYLLSKNSQPYLDKIIEFILSIEITSEIYRFLGIVIALKGEVNDDKESDKVLELSLQSFFKLSFGPLRYTFCVVKTKIDLLIYAARYFDAANLCENTYNSVLREIPNEDTDWLKYQYCKTLIYLSNYVTLTLDLRKLNDQLIQFRDDAEFY